MLERAFPVFASCYLQKSSAPTRSEPDPRTRQIIHYPEPLLLDVTYNGQPTHSTRKSEAEAPTAVHRNQVIRRRQRHVGSSEMQHHRRHLHFPQARQIEARVEQRELRCPFQAGRSYPESIAERYVSGSGQACDGRARIYYNPSVTGGIEFEQGSGDAGDTCPTHADTDELHIVKGIKLGVSEQWGEPGGPGNSRVSKHDRGRFSRRGPVYQTVRELLVEPPSGLRGER